MTPYELRVKIAEAKGYIKGEGPMDAASAKYGGFEWWRTPEGRKTSVLPDWPQDISAAWHLIEEAEAKGVGYSMSDCHHSDGRITHDFAFFAPVIGPASRKYWSEAETVPLAICEAYVKMLEGER